MNNSFFCHECGECMDDVPLSTSGEKSSCPKCGSYIGDLHIEVEDKIKVNSHMTATGAREGRTIGFRESVREGRTTSADRDNDCSFSYSILGSSPQGEEDTLLTCRALVRFLNASGESWTEPLPGSGNEDCVANNLLLPGKKLHIQVIRAIIDQDLWKELNNQGSIEKLNVSKEQLATQMMEAVKKKANEQAIPQKLRSCLTLAVDANRLPVLGFEDVVEEFRVRFGAWAKSLGFEAVWLVGPIDSLTWRLDNEG